MEWWKEAKDSDRPPAILLHEKLPIKWWTLSKEHRKNFRFWSLNEHKYFPKQDQYQIFLMYLALKDKLPTDFILCEVLSKIWIFDILPAIRTLCS